MDPQKPGQPRQGGVVHLNEDDPYLQRIEDAKKKTVPLGGAPMPAMKPLDEYRGVDPRTAGVQGGARFSPTQLLNPEQIAALQAQGKFIPGVGSNLAMNQPFAHEVMHLGKPAQPQQTQTTTSAQQAAPAPEGPFHNPPRPAGAGLTEKTVEGLVELAKVNAQQTEERKREMSDEEFRAEIDKIAADVDYAGLNRRVNTVLEHPERRRRIELRCEPLDFEQLLFHFELRQRVPIIKDKYEPTFRTVAGNEDLAIKETIGIEARAHNDDQYIVDKFSLMNLTAALFSLNDRVFPSHLDKESEFDKAAFLVKFKLVMRYPILLLGDLSINFVWFNQRVQKTMLEGDLVDSGGIKGF